MESGRIIPDTSVIINGLLSQMIERGELRDVEIVIPVAALDELQAQASKGRAEGVAGLNEIKKIRELGSQANISVKFAGERPTLEDIKLARGGRIDAIIRDVAKREGGVLYTSDYVQYLVAEAEGVPVKYVAPEKPEVKVFEEFFTQDTMSVHLKAGAPPMAKRGRPGSFVLERLRDEPLNREEVEAMIKGVMEKIRTSDGVSIEIARSGAIVAQLGEYRIAITRPPFSDDPEVTIVRPIARLRLEDYALSEKLFNRLAHRAEGILIAGPPGSGKTTFASSLADFYASMGKVVKTFESPRDLNVKPEVTQYGPLEGDFEKTAEILLLVRPDYTIFDEMRRGKDFQVYADMRLAGVGMVGVIHASDPIDAVQRFLGRVELGMLPHVIDTVIFIKEGRIEKVYELSLVVRVPTGMKDEDLARPIVEVKDFETGRLEYEIYTFGEETTIVPVTEEISEEEREAIKERVTKVVRRVVKGSIEVDVVSKNSAIVKVDQDDVPRLLGKKGSVIKSIETKLGMKIRVEPKVPSMGEEVEYGMDEVGNSMEFRFKDVEPGSVVSFYVDGKYLFSATVGKGGKIRISKSSEVGRALLKALMGRSEVKAVLPNRK